MQCKLSVLFYVWLHIFTEHGLVGFKSGVVENLSHRKVIPTCSSTG